MPCTPFSIGNARGFICTRGPRPRCACGQSASLQCDGPSKRRSKTCDKRLCTSCAKEVGPDRHLCPQHAASGFATENEEAGPVQEGLF